MSKRKHFNRKRRILDNPPPQANLEKLANRVRYEGSPYHKRNPGDFGLTPPSQPRLDATLCDEVGITTVAEAQRLLREGIRNGLISSNDPHGYPKYVWVVTEEGNVFEASHTRDGHYHGYPLFDPDPFRQVVLDHWDKK